ncbi:MAG: glycerol-3-phosphate dehydrogenase C-terminal domain-containing protein, partial [Acetobacteraceae bacterium]
YSGVRPLHDDGSGDPSATTRDYVLTLDAPEGAAPLLSVFGGKITTYRRLAEHALADLTPLLPARRGNSTGWTAQAPLPGGGFPVDGLARLVTDTETRWPFLPAATARRLCRTYGTCVATLLGESRSLEDLGTDFGAGLTEAELRYLVTHEWARTAEDVIWRRTKLGLHLSPVAVHAIDAAMRGMAGQTSGETKHGAAHPGH